MQDKNIKRVLNNSIYGITGNYDLNNKGGQTLLTERINLLKEKINELNKSKETKITTHSTLDPLKNCVELRAERGNKKCVLIIPYHTLIHTDLNDLAHDVCEYIESSLSKSEHNFHEIRHYKQYILSTRDYKKGKEMLDDAVAHGVITQKEYWELNGYTDGLRDGGKQ